MVGRFIQRFAAVSACSALLAGCKGESWGDDFKSFVENDVPGLAQEFADTQFNRKWANALNDQIVFAAEQLGATTAVAIDLKLPEIPDDLEMMEEAALVELYVQLLNTGMVLDQIEAKTVAARRQLQRAQVICGDRRAFDFLDLNNEVVRGIFAIAAPEKNETWFISNNLFELAMFWVVELFGRSEREKQEDAFNDGMAKLQEIIPRDDVLFATSSAICNARFNEAKPQIDKLTKGFVELRSFVGKRRAEQVAAQRLVETQVLRVGAERLEREFGLDHIYLRNAKLAQSEVVEAALASSFISYLKLVSDAANATDPVIRLILEEKAETYRQGLLSDFERLERGELALSTEALIDQQKSYLAPQNGGGQ